MITGRDFVFTGLQSFDITIGSNAKDIAKEIAKHNRVLYVNTPLDVLTYWGREMLPETQQRRAVVKGQANPLRKVSDNFWVLDLPFTLVPVNTIPDGPLFDLVNRYNNWRIFRYINKMLSQLHFKNVIHFSDNDIYRSFYAKEFLDATTSVLYLRDMLSEVPFWQKHIHRLEPLLFSKSDLVLANSPQLAEYAAVHTPHAFNVGQGVDLPPPSRQGQVLPELSAMTQPIIGYMGAITSLRLDYDLLFSLAKSRPNYAFVFVGPEDETFLSHPMLQLENVYSFGSKSMSEINNYIQYFDICLNPQLINRMTNCNYPRKIDDYLALGKPIVATPTETMQLFEGYYWKASTSEEYALAIDQIISSLPEPREVLAKRIALAQSHSWENNVLAIYQKIAKYS